MYFTHSPPLSLCWYDRLLYELWIHDLCLNPSSTSPDIFYAETSRHSPPPGHAATWQPSDHVTGCHEPRDSGDPASCNEVPGPCYITRPCQTLAYRRDSYLKRWKLFWHNIRGELFDCVATYCCSGLVVAAGTKKPCISPLLMRVVCSLCWLSSPHYGCRGSRRNIRIQIGTHPPPPHSHYILQSDFNGG